MRTDITKLKEDVRWQDLTVGCSVQGSKTSELFRTGEWRVNTPVFDAAKCKQCLLCVPTVLSRWRIRSGKNLTLSIAKDAGSVRMYVLLMRS